MNEDKIFDNIEILGFSKNYKPNNAIFHTDKEDYLFKKCIVVFSYLNGGDRIVFKVKYYDKFSNSDFNVTDRQHFAYIIYCTEKESIDIIADIKKNPSFNP